MSDTAKINRAHTFICTIGADTIEALISELNWFALELERGKITSGSIGGPSVGSTYSYRHDPAMTHDEYFRRIDEWLKKERLVAQEPKND